jgi:hypothetical protein
MRWYTPLLGLLINGHSGQDQSQLICTLQVVTVTVRADWLRYLVHFCGRQMGQFAMPGACRACVCGRIADADSVMTS